MLTAIEMFCNTDNVDRDPLRPTLAVFLDRDGTVIQDTGYLDDGDELKLIEGADQALRIFAEASFKIVIISNQAGLARGIFTEDKLQPVHNRFMEVIAAAGVELAACYYCPFYGDGKVEKFCKTSDARKPAPGMILRAASRLNICLPQSWMIGDRWDDVGCGIAAGTHTVKLSGNMDKSPKPPHVKCDFFADTLLEAAKMIVDQKCVSKQV